MNIILLSGGSGKRLWPLSNDVRSKQFIKLFKNNDGYESMVQRVYRQVTTVDADAKITIATSKSQASAIKNQLGEKASICVEPCRRDTFPAIALAVAYLHDELGVAENEAVVVCPVDPYVDNTYYEAVKNLQELAKQGGANLTLMGIEPTYPSEKYGYIIPESGENVSKVKEFKEKPDVETAKKYLAQSALWNAGIFAFKLGYLLNKAHSMIDFEDYRDLFNKYDTLTKISFDYAVVENESSIQVLRYSGDWKDVGTLGSYWEANMELIDIIPEFNLYEEFWKIYTKGDIIPPQYIAEDAVTDQCLIGEGAEIYGEVYHSVIGPNVVIGRGTVVRDSIIMRNSQIGEDTVLDKAIVAEDVVIGNKVTLGFGEEAANVLKPAVYAFGLATVGERSVIPDNVKIGRNTAISGVTTAEDYPGGILESGQVIKAKDGEQA